MTALKVLLLVDSEGHPSEELEELVHAEGDDRRALLRRILERFYTPVFELDLPRASRGQFHEAFRSFGTKEGVLTKCEAFFIRAAQAAGIELSRRILAGRHGANRTRNTPAAGRSRTATAQAAAPEVTFRCDTENFVLLAYQRITLAAALADGRIAVEGDRELADQFAE